MSQTVENLAIVVLVAIILEEKNTESVEKQRIKPANIQSEKCFCSPHGVSALSVFYSTFDN